MNAIGLFLLGRLVGNCIPGQELIGLRPRSIAGLFICCDNE